MHLRYIKLRWVRTMRPQGNCLPNAVRKNFYGWRLPMEGGTRISSIVYVVENILPTSTAVRSPDYRRGNGVALLHESAEERVLQPCLTHCAGCALLMK
jgi:hypothetical protein